MATRAVEDLTNIGTVAEGDKLVAQRVDGTTVLVTHDIDINLDDTPKLGGNLDINGKHIIDINGNELLKFTAVASAINEITLSNAIASGYPMFAATGDDANIGIRLQAKASGTHIFESTATIPVQFRSGTSSLHITNFIFANTSATRSHTFQDADGTVYQTDGTDVSVADGGSGRSTATAYAPLLGGTTATGAHQSMASGLSGQLAASQGPAAVPIWTTPTYPTASGTAGKLLQSDGTNNVYSTSAWPTASATSRKMIVSNGTDWVASTETWAVPGSQYNVLQSDGTNWTAATPTGTGAPVLQTAPSIVNPSIKDSNSVTVLAFTAVASAVNNINLSNSAASGAFPVMKVEGSDTDIGLRIDNKGSGYTQIRTVTGDTPVQFISGTAVHTTNFNFANTNVTRTVTFPDSDFTVAPTVSPSFTTPALGTPASGALTNCTSIPVANATGILPIANGGTAVADSDPVIQRVKNQTGAVATGTTIFPVDDTIPQITEGVEFMTLAITPKNTANILVIDVVCLISSSYAGAIAMGAALFQDSTANALAGMTGTFPGQYYMIPVVFRHVMTAGTTSSTTFRVRAGANGAGTTTFNGLISGRTLGGVVASSITITEYAA